MRNRKKVFILSLCILTVIVFFLTATLGINPVPLRKVFLIMLAKLKLANFQDDFIKTIVINIRLPRIITAACVGMSLAAAGAVYQGIFRNPLVEPFILGVSSGAAFGAALAIVLPSFFFSVELGAFAVSLLGVFAAYSIAKVRGQTPLVTLILAGVVINSLFSALVSVLQYLSTSSELREIIFWLLGGFYYSSWSDVYKILPVTLLGLILLWISSWKLNVLSLGDDEARSLGLRSERTKIYFICIATLITSVSVSVAGIIAWVGLMIPHAARLILGPDHRYLLPASALMGGIFLMLCDALARSVTTSEIPIGIITSIIGAPYIIFLIKTKRKIFYG